MSYGLIARRPDIVKDDSWFGVHLWPHIPTRWEEFTIARDALAEREPGRVLDAGCGFVPGAHVMPEIAARLGWQVEAIDILEERYGDELQKWHDFEPNDRINRRIMDMRVTDYESESFDAYLCISVLEHMTIEDRRAALDEAHRVVKPGGLIVVTMDGHHSLDMVDGRWDWGEPVPLDGERLTTEDGVPITFAVGEKRVEKHQPTITIAATVYNEADRFLRPALECWSALSDRIVIQDNASTDDTVAICEEFGAEIHRFETSMDGNETAVMRNLWEIATRDADWVVFMDADQCFAGDFRPHLKGNRCGFMLYDLWSPRTYRVDRWWKVRPWTKAVKMTEFADFEWIWPERGWHTGHVPSNVGLLGPLHPIPRECGVLHYACASPELRERQFRGYMGRREHLTPLELMHARTIMDPAPNTPELPFEPRWRLL